MLRKLVVDLFAGGGGASTALEAVFQQPVDIAVNHDHEALAMHRVNHPKTRHYCEDVRKVNPRIVTRGLPVGWLHLSPDCTDHSQAKGGQPRSKATRALSWQALHWVGTVRPDVVSLENVEQLLKWAPLVAKRCRTTRRVVRLDGSVAGPGERVPVHEQFLVPDPNRTGQRWRQFVGKLRAHGGRVEHRVLNAADYGANTKRERLFVLAVFDGRPIVWPEPARHQRPSANQARWRPAAEHIDLSTPCPSIFTRTRPLAEATMRRIATGVQRYVLSDANPFIMEFANWSRERLYGVDQPLPTMTAKPAGGSFAICAPTLVQTGYGERAGQAPRSLDIRQPVGTLVAGGGKHALCAAFLAQMNGGHNTVLARPLREPISTITTTGSQQQLVTTALSKNDEAGALRVAAFLMRYYGTGGQWGDLRQPAATITTRDRLALVTVLIQGEPWVIVDIGLRMLTPRELFCLQGFPQHYVINRGLDELGNVIALSKKAQTRMVGNSVPPHPLMRLIECNHHQPQQLEQAA